MRPIEGRMHGIRSRVRPLQNLPCSQNAQSRDALQRGACDCSHGSLMSLKRWHVAPRSASHEATDTGILSLHRLTLHRLTLHRLTLHRLTLHRLTFYLDGHLYFVTDL